MAKMIIENAHVCRVGSGDFPETKDGKETGKSLPFHFLVVHEPELVKYGNKEQIKDNFYRVKVAVDDFAKVADLEHCDCDLTVTVSDVIKNGAVKTEYKFVSVAV